MSHVDNYVWLRTSTQVVGWSVEDLNAMIDEFNSFPWAPEADFFQWLSWKMNDGYDYQGFSVIWNSRSKAANSVHKIRKG